MITYLRESALGEDDQKTGLAASTITNDDKLPSNFGHAKQDGKSDEAKEGQIREVVID